MKALIAHWLPFIKIEWQLHETELPAKVKEAGDILIAAFDEWVNDSHA